MIVIIDNNNDDCVDKSYALYIKYIPLHPSSGTNW